MVRTIAFIILGSVLFSCQSTEKLPSASEVRSLDTIVVLSEKVLPPYQPTPTMKWELLHTALDLNFNYTDQEVNGQAILTLHPYFYNQTELTLHAKWMQISQVTSVTGQTFKFRYENNEIVIDLDSSYAKEDTLKISIKYIAKPLSNTDKGGRAITASKGIYFINPKQNIANKPTQIWTQGETNFSSCWFPTIDHPNQKTTQEIKLTVNERYTTLSNGSLEFSSINGDGTRTDYWKQDKAHSPYLFMIAIGEFTITKDEWREKEVSYFLEEEYTEDARNIFGNTPEMLEFYSNILGVEYPWDKYSQVVVRDFVSGAMENTSATIHGSFVQNHKRELLDYNPDDIIAHELFHQWFGDLVSCESWSNLPLNESFATYGEFLWYEYKYGGDTAEMKLHNNLKSYLRESNYKRENWVRFRYNEMDDMFDGHSYSKGARILHMLRTIVGDDAFFSSLKLYLNRYAHKSAEMHQLRLCFEEITGEDLNWFFDQWAYASGHPNLDFSHSYDSLNKIYSVEIEQIKDDENTPTYRLPIKIDIYTEAGVERLDYLISEEKQTFYFDGSKPKLVNLDAEKYLLCEKKENLSEGELIYKYYNAPHYIDRLESLQGLNDYSELTPESGELLFAALNSSFYGIQLQAMKLAYKMNLVDSIRLRSNLKELVDNDPNPKVRAEALNVLSNFGVKENVKKIAVQSLNDSSYAVVANGLSTLIQVDSNLAYKEATKLKTMENLKVRYQVLSIFSQFGSAKELEWMINMNIYTNGYGKSAYVWQFKKYILRLNDLDITNHGIAHLKEIYFNSSQNKVKEECLYGLKEIDTQIRENISQQSTSEEGNPATGASEKAKFQIEFLEELFNQIKSTETDEKLLRILEN